MPWAEYLLAVGIVAAFFAGRGTANAGAYDRGYEDGYDDAIHGRHRSSIERRQPAVGPVGRARNNHAAVASTRPTEHASRQAAEAREHFAAEPPAAVLDPLHSGSVQDDRSTVMSDRAEGYRT